MPGLVYTPTGWVDDITPTSAANMNNIENGIAQVTSRVNAIDALVGVFDFNGQTADFDITGLAGDTDMGYEFTAVGRLAGTGLILVRPNGDSSNAYAGLYNQTVRTAASSVSNGVGNTAALGLQLSNNPGTTPYYIATKALLSAKSQSGQYGRPWRADWTGKSEVVTGEALMQSVSQWWNPATSTTTINKLTLNFGSAFTGRITVKRV